MRFRFDVSPRAEREIQSADDWWRQNRTKAPLAFAEDFEVALSVLEDLPYAGEKVRHRRIPGLRRLLLGRVQYYLYYVPREEQGVIEILSLWHTSRGRPPRL